MDKNKLEIIAFYLPQFFPIKENDEWWGKGFTEWTNVAKAKPLFKNHYQPRIPADLGFYDLRVAEVRKQQAQLAEEAGVTAFCYWHYWFGNGKRLLERVFDEVLESGEPKFPFCLGWANHSWYAKTWDKDSIKKDRLLIEQTYPGLDDAKAHFDYLLKAFKDDRYVKIDNRPFLFIFEPNSLPDLYLNSFQKWAKDAGFDGLYLIANIKPYEKKEKYLSKGYSAVLINRTQKSNYTQTEIEKMHFVNHITNLRAKYIFLDKIFKIRRKLIELFIKPSPSIIDYKYYFSSLITKEEYEENVIPQMMPQWDHTPRSGIRGLVWKNATPDFFYKHALETLKAVEDKQHPLIILKSWNEWGEGNYMEPDTVYGHGFIDALNKAINKIDN